MLSVASYRIYDGRYTNLASRLHYGFNVFDQTYFFYPYYAQYAQYYGYNTRDLAIATQRFTGAQLFAEYPLDTFRRLEVGVGAHDREAFLLIHGAVPPDEALGGVVDGVREHRRVGAAPHPLNRLASERLLRETLLADPSLVGASTLRSAAPPVPRQNVKDAVPCVAVGSDAAGRSLVVVISDFITAPGWERPLLQLAERNEVVAIRLVDPREYELPDAGVIVVEDAETGDQLTVDSSDAEFRHRLKAAGEAREAELREATLRAGVDIHEVSTEDDLVPALVRIVHSRRSRRR